MDVSCGFNSVHVVTKDLFRDPVLNLAYIFVIMQEDLRKGFKSYHTSFNRGLYLNMVWSTAAE